ncbi:MAG: Asp-tRNA(Asn)/Glu-tRNA(Gln) amidotransferase subunit GatA [Thiothrix sp.]|uniref:Asp-tRNA(Asn)/Glu-tRNA(Gln) amidotransferase subunit GatA n=1 Tax=Thiothrix sp. TaxID=1032 RepID=UPI002621F578|nr:Asp-tRNA(Asn)/Glu-tRNA(Gln) amidotransferase subunit GatA [Thiothrix sp.]MDD5393100.1 Asp-tRNA(Asn)/Glu-tRNA(Gln) amidotransferase subunit GatA [Thiothrix sp.]
MHSLSLKKLRDGIHAGNFSVMEATDAYLERIANFNEELNAFITVTRDSAQAQAVEIDNRIRKGELDGAMAGLPYALKDLFCSKDVLTTCGSNMLRNFVSPYDAHVAERLKAAGGVLLGKNNMDEFAMGSSNETSAFGNVRNPWDTDCVPGGSSGGGAATVAARLAPVALGSDTGGSIRQPASFCNITGIKPTYGRISRYGMIAFASSLDQCGPMAPSAEDCAITLNVIAGLDARDSTSVDRPVPDYTATLNDSIDGLKIGLPKEFFAEGLNPQVGAVIERAIKEFEARGAIIKEVTLPNSHLAVPVYYVVAPAECSSNLSRFDGVRFGHRCENPQDLKDLYERSRWEGFGAEVKRRIMIGTYALSAGYYDAYYLKAQKIRRLIQQDFAEAFKDVDVIMGPSAPTTAFKLGAKKDDPIAMYLEDLYTIPVSLAGLPGMTFPIGFAADGLPVGMQLVGNYFEEARMLNIAHQYQLSTDWHTQVPAKFA